MARKRDFFTSVDGLLNTVNVSLLLHNHMDRLKNIVFLNLKAMQSCILCNYILDLTNNHIIAKFTLFIPQAL